MFCSDPKWNANWGCGIRFNLFNFELSLLVLLCIVVCVLTRSHVSIIWLQDYTVHVIYHLQAASEWLFIVPWGIGKTLVWLTQRYENPPLFVTENGQPPF